MKPTPTAAALFTPAEAWATLWLKLGETLWASSQVIGHRTELMSKAGVMPSAADQREMLLMGSEKVQAFSEASQRAAQGLASMAPALPWKIGTDWLRMSSAASSLATSTTWAQALARQATLWKVLSDGAPAASQLSQQLAKVSTRTLAPVHAKATANARRLNAKRLQKSAK